MLFALKCIWKRGYEKYKIHCLLKEENIGSLGNVEHANIPYNYVWTDKNQLFRKINNALEKPWTLHFEDKSSCVIVRIFYMRIVFKIGFLRLKYYFKKIEWKFQSICKKFWIIFRRQLYLKINSMNFLCNKYEEIYLTSIITRR